jgi:DtxR family transcriptional regulator, Mn-dependent transcriptional regulator
MSVLERRTEAASLTHSAAHHLLAAADSIDELGYARVSDIGRRLELTRGSVSVAMQSLRKAGYVDQDANRFFHLTDRGQRAAVGIRARHDVVQRFLIDILALSPEKAHSESCRMEHLLTAETTRRLYTLLEFLKSQGLQDDMVAAIQAGCPDCETQGSQCPCCGLAPLDDSCGLTMPDAK